MYVEVNTTFESIECCNCGIVFAVSKERDDRWRQKHERFYCPSGHPQSYRAESEEEKLRAKLASARERADHYQDQRDRLERSNIAIRGHQTRLRKRIRAGCCPCCNRTFQNLQRHMKSQHPKYGGKSQ